MNDYQLTGWFVAWPNRLREETPTPDTQFNSRGWGEILGLLDQFFVVRVIEYLEPGEPSFYVLLPYRLPGLRFFKHQIDVTEWHAFWNQDEEDEEGRTKRYDTFPRR
jgi:hypothetical protein